MSSCSLAGIQLFNCSIVSQTSKFNCTLYCHYQALTNIIKLSMWSVNDFSSMFFKTAVGFNFSLHSLLTCCSLLYYKAWQSQFEIKNVSAYWCRASLSWLGVNYLPIKQTSVRLLPVSWSGWRWTQTLICLHQWFLKHSLVKFTFSWQNLRGLWHP